MAHYTVEMVLMSIIAVSDYITFYNLKVDLLYMYDMIVIKYFRAV